MMSAKFQKRNSKSKKVNTVDPNVTALYGRLCLCSVFHHLMVLFCGKTCLLKF